MRLNRHRPEVQPAARKKEFFCVQVRDIEILKPDRAAAVHREVDYGVVPGRR